MHIYIIKQWLELTVSIGFPFMSVYFVDFLFFLFRILNKKRYKKTSHLETFPVVNKSGFQPQWTIILIK